MSNLLTLRQIAAELGIPPSTVAFYKNTDNNSHGNRTATVIKPR